MAIIKCKMCGGTVDFNSGDKIGVCDSCGTKQTLPRLDDDRKASLYDRANHLRLQNEFDKASNIYEQILNENPEDCESYWSLVLCRYGIEYVEDPQSGNRVPTVNRTQFKSIFDDDDYKTAIKLADPEQKEIYENEASAIDEIQKGILQISQSEEPFDVFICYKESDSNGKRTRDSVYAQQIYDELTKEGFKVFFARITLESKLGSAYEPYIFAALNSSKVMIVLGSCKEYFNAVWVKNEWSRFLSLMKKDSSKKLIPAYKDMDPYDLPEEFSFLQSQDMSKLGFAQDLIRGIKKIIQKGDTNSHAKGAAKAGSPENSEWATLLKRAKMFLEDKDWKSANTYCEKILDKDPENAEAFYIKLLAEFYAESIQDLVFKDSQITDSKNYKWFRRNASEKRLQEFDNQVTEAQYQHAFTVIENAKNSNDYIVANGIFMRIPDYKESADLAEKCTVFAEGMAKYEEGISSNSKSAAIFEEAMEKFNSIPAFSNADELAKKCAEQIENINNQVYRGALATATKGNKESFELAIKTLELIKDWKDAAALISEYKGNIEKIDAELKRKEELRKAAEIKAAKKKKRAKRAKRFISFLIVIGILGLVGYYYEFELNGQTTNGLQLAYKYILILVDKIKMLIQS